MVLLSTNNHLIEMVLLSTNNICFGGETRKLVFWYALLTKGLKKSGEPVNNLKSEAKGEVDPL